MAKVLLTGSAGFIGYHVAKTLAQDSRYEVLCLDNINDYYDVGLKYARLEDLGFETGGGCKGIISSRTCPRLRFIRLDLADREGVSRLFKDESFEYVIHLAAQAGVRYSLENPYAYIDSNIYGFLNILEGCRHNPVRHLLYASSSSVYGLNSEVPFSEDHNVDCPASLYACTKKADELMAHSYSHLFGIPCTGLRFFTVYGPWGRPDMACFLFTRKIYSNEPIDIYNHGDMRRDFTYISDVVSAIVSLLPIVPEPMSKEGTNSKARCCIYNIGNNSPVALMEFIETLESLIGITSRKNLMPMQPGDVLATYADITNIQRHTSFHPQTPLREGLKAFVDWYKATYRIDQG
ncbi:MAG: NAD-dependent epimerase/dehydratase family protein [Synergistaceae bacterium]|jgi:UDP-glucuronate 4-epimerase|nr:NAD-dependent epimerase/dehydratase family protein [Synergistaceae bacterium]